MKYTSNDSFKDYILTLKYDRKSHILFLISEFYNKFNDKSLDFEELLYFILELKDDISRINYQLKLIEKILDDLDSGEI